MSAAEGDDSLEVTYVGVMAAGWMKKILKHESNMGSTRAPPFNQDDQEIWGEEPQGDRESQDVRPFRT